MAERPKPTVVHSSFGRLRVHLPDPDGYITPQVRALPGVHSAEWNKWTENILVLYSPEQTTEQQLLAQLEAIATAERPATMPIESNAPGGTEQSSISNRSSGLPAELAAGESLLAIAGQAERPDAYVTGFRRRLYKVLGWASVGMAVVGVLLPGIPGAPFALLAGYFFMRSSPQAHEWLLQTRLFGSMLREWEEHRAVRRSVKLGALALVGGSIVFTLFVGLPEAVVVTVVALQIVGLAVVLRLPVIQSQASAPAIA